jgi:DNA-binding NarL/FixJ family response regulator
MLHAGAMGYVTKLRAGQELLDAIRQVGNNQTYLSPELDGRVAAEMLRLASGP